jgi:DNA-binding XRE family transcriptional regulator
MMMASQAAGIMASTDEQEAAKAMNAATPADFPDAGNAPKPADENKKADDASAVSSLTGAGFDQEIVEELHQALTDLRAELEGSRAEAARAVKVAEQAIQSAENNSSKDWNSTVTHKAAEAAALAQKRSAEAMAKQRLAEERLAAERKTATFWRKQAEAAEEEAGVLQTRAAAAEVQRAAMSEELDSERRKATALVTTMKQRYTTSEAHQNDALESALERNRSLLIELDSTRRELELKSREANTMEETYVNQCFVRICFERLQPHVSLFPQYLQTPYCQRKGRRKDFPKRIAGPQEEDCNGGS